MPKTPSNKPITQGWGVNIAPRAKHYHYFVNTFSLCGKVGFYRSDLEQGNDDHPENCPKCRKALAERKASNA